MKATPDGVKEYSLELISTECNTQTIYRLRMRWNAPVPSHSWRRYRKTWKYKIIQNAMNKLNTLVTRFGQPQEIRIFGYSSDVTELGLRIVSGPAEPR